MHRIIFKKDVMLVKNFITQINHQTNLKMIHILKRLHSQDEDSDNINYQQETEDSSLSEETIYKILSGHHVITWRTYSRSTAVASGELSKLIKPWEPWWMKPLANFISLGQHGTPLVQPLPNQNQVVCLLFYARQWRIGESDLCGISAAKCFSISSVLGEGGLPETVSQALSHCLEQTCSPAFRHTGVCLLSDLRRLIQASRRDKNLEEEDTLRRKEFKNKLKAAERKVYFITCWVNEQPEEAWSSLATIVNAEKASAMECQGKKPESSHVKDKVENKGKPLIKEIG
ncbi:hypothetical protein Leryth_012321 [Lithospermum erythrorhizon]|nr:hypothetical protein Leryth_012321 [Lithospermum erythrorhizon]